VRTMFLKYPLFYGALFLVSGLLGEDLILDNGTLDLESGMAVIFPNEVNVNSGQPRLFVQLEELIKR